MAWGVNDQQTGLTSGSAVYVAANGTDITHSATSSKLGLAISATEIVVSSTNYPTI